MDYLLVTDLCSYINLTCAARVDARASAGCISSSGNIAVVIGDRDVGRRRIVRNGLMNRIAIIHFSRLAVNSNGGLAIIDFSRNLYWHIVVILISVISGVRRVV